MGGKTRGCFFKQGSEPVDRLSCVPAPSLPLSLLLKEEEMKKKGPRGQKAACGRNGATSGRNSATCGISKVANRALALVEPSETRLQRAESTGFLESPRLPASSKTIAPSPALRVFTNPSGSFVIRGCGGLRASDIKPSPPDSHAGAADRGPLPAPWPAPGRSPGSMRSGRPGTSRCPCAGRS